MTDDTEWPLGPVLEGARTERGLATREAARRANLSDTMWRNLERGYELRKGVRFPITPKPETVARAARAVGLPIDIVFPLAGIEIELAAAHQHQPIDLRAVPDEELVGELLRRLTSARGADPETREILTDRNRFTTVNKQSLAAGSTRRETGP